jgi:hypothetical protein
MQLGAEDVDLGAAHASSERRHPRSDLRHELRARGPPRLESARVEEEPRRGAAYPVARKERIGHGKDHRRHGKLVPRTFSCGGGPGRPRCRAWEADSTSSEARKRTGEELPRTWKVGSDDGRASSDVVGSLFRVVWCSSEVVDRSDDDLGRGAEVPGGCSDALRRTTKVAGCLVEVVGSLSEVVGARSHVGGNSDEVLSDRTPRLTWRFHGASRFQLTWCCTHPRMTPRTGRTDPWHCTGGSRRRRPDHRSTGLCAHARLTEAVRLRLHGAIRVEIDETPPARQDAELEDVGGYVPTTACVAEGLGPCRDHHPAERRQLRTKGLYGARVDDLEVDGTIGDSPRCCRIQKARAGTSRPQDVQGTLGAAAWHREHASAMALRSSPQ